jgi:hypothetical protein
MQDALWSLPFGGGRARKLTNNLTPATRPDFPGGSKHARAQQRDDRVRTPGDGGTRRRLSHLTARRRRL